MTRTESVNNYVLGHKDAELARLQHQSEFFEDATSALLKLAGIVPGMRVLDLGCGVGDVSMSLARLLDGKGDVVGIDRAEGALTMARQRVEASDLRRVEFVQGDFMTADLGAFDAVVGRFVLLHFPQPEVVLARAQRLLTSGGLVVFAEMDIGSTSAWPPFPDLDACIGWILDLYAKSGLDPQMGSRLYSVFRKAGLTPDLTATCRIEAGAQARGLDYLVETLRTMKPMLIALGIAKESQLDLPTLASTLAQAMSEEDRCVIFPRLVGAWARSG